MSRLEECVEHHAGEEEREMFPRVEDFMSEEKRAELGRALQARKRKAQPARRVGAKRRPGTMRRARTTRAARARSRGRAKTARSRAKKAKRARR
jgi:hypothetical protein